MPTLKGWICIYFDLCICIYIYMIFIYSIYVTLSFYSLESSGWSRSIYESYLYWVGICNSRHPFPYNGSWWLRNIDVSRKLLRGGGGAIALKPPKANVPLVGNWRSCLIIAMTLHFEMVVSGGKVADHQRVGILSSLGEFSIRIRFSLW